MECRSYSLWLTCCCCCCCIHAWIPVVHVLDPSPSRFADRYTASAKLPVVQQRVHNILCTEYCKMICTHSERAEKINIERFRNKRFNERFQLLLLLYRRQKPKHKNITNKVQIIFPPHVICLNVSDGPSSPIITKWLNSRQIELRSN